MSNDLELKWLDSFSEIEEDDWNLLVPDDNPFYHLRFLKALENSRSIGAETSWQIRLLLAYKDSKIIAALVNFQKWDSYGEYIFDFEWAQAYQRAGLSYYPKLSLAIPFTPTTGNRILIQENISNKEQLVSSLLEEAVQYAKAEGHSSYHILFHTEEEDAYFQRTKFSQRLTHQYHWINRGYQSFDDYLAALKKDKRKSIRKEREPIRNSSLQIVILEKEQIDPELWQVYWSFYQNTHSKKWGQAYLRKEFFQEIFQTFRDHLILVLAKDASGKPIAGTLNFRGKNILFGRYWGAVEDIPNLHFELCYYQLIDYAIANQLKKFEAGAQGEHKYLRGFEVVPIYSSHMFFNSQANQSIANYLDRECENTKLAIEEWNLKSPLKIFREEGAKP
jgi:uncharacterized protein